MAQPTVAPGVKELLRDALGDQAVEQLTPKAMGRIVGALFSAAYREIQQPDPAQLTLDQQRPSVVRAQAHNRAHSEDAAA